MQAFTPKQEEVLKQVHSLLDEHFDAAVFVVLAECGQPVAEAVAAQYCGGRMAALGLLEQGKHQLLQAEPDDYGDLPE